MIRSSICLLAVFTTVTLFSCKKEKHTTTPTTPIDSPVVYDDYMALKPGNYWIYQDYMLDSVNGDAHAQGTYDSCFVEKDTIINDNTYHKYFDVILFSGATPAYDIYYLKDSLSYTVNEKGIIQFSSTDFTSVFRNFLYGPNSATSDTLVVTEQMGFKDAATVVDAGTFTTSTFRRIYQYPASYPYGPTREYDFRYAKNIGLVSKTSGFYNALPSLYERRLVRYHVQ